MDIFHLGRYLTLSLFYLVSMTLHTW